MSETPRTVAEQLDAASSGQEFAGVLEGLFTRLDKARQAEENEAEDDE